MATSRAKTHWQTAETHGMVILLVHCTTVLFLFGFTILIIECNRLVTLDHFRFFFVRGFVLSLYETVLKALPCLILQ